MQEQVVTFETAKLAKEKGFDWEVFNSIATTILWKTEQKQFSRSLTKFNFNDFGKGSGVVFYSQPTQSFLQKWLREVYNLYVESNPNASGYGWFIDKTNGTHIKGCEFEGPNDGGRWDKYEDALEVGLQEALQLI